MTNLRADLGGRTVLLNGGNTGIGTETAIGPARLGARVVLTSRDPEPGQATLADVRAAVPDAEVDVLPLDLASLDSVRTADAARRLWEVSARLVSRRNPARAGA